MKLYYGLTNYHLLCCILHRLIYNSNEEAIFVASQGILKSRIETLEESNIFDTVYYLEDTNIRNKYFEGLNEKTAPSEIEKIANEFSNKYEKILPFNINEFDDFYLSADHGVFGIYILIKKCLYTYLEDGRGIYSNWKILDGLLKIKNPGIREMSRYYKAYGKSDLIKEKYIAFDSQDNNCNFKNCIDFDINNLLDKLSTEQLNKIFKVFNIKLCNKYATYKKNALILTQRFTAYNMLKEEECILMYALLCDIFASDCNIYLKPHPADKCKYDNVFREAILLEKELPSELIRYIINKNFDIGISTYSSSIYSLKPYIKDIYNIDESVVSFRDDIFKLYTLFELAKKVRANVIIKEKLLDGLFKKCYNLTQDIQYYFNYTDDEVNDSIIVKNENFKEANYIIRIYKSIENEFISQNLLENKEYLYMKIKNSEIIQNIIDFRLDKILPISKVHITAYIEKV